MPPIEAVATEEKKSVVGFIYPPPEVRNIVDKTANFVARNGPEFEARIRQNEQNNAKFNFLNVGDPYHAYYQHKVNECRAGKGEKEAAPPIGQKQSSVSQQQQLKQQELLRAAVQESLAPKEAPSEFEFVADPPSISAFDLDVVKLTAQFVARNGRQFLTTLMNREQRNNQFDFLRPQHSLFQYFTRLLEQYTKVLIPPKDLMKRLEAESLDSQACMKQMKQRVDWERHQAAVRQKEEEELERERLEYAAIDWHDFSVVETIDYQPWEVGSFPPPTTPQEVGRRVLLQERIDDGVAPDNDMVLDSDEEEEAENVADGEGDDTQVQDMEEGSSESEESEEEEDDEGLLMQKGTTTNNEKSAPPLPKEPPQPAPIPPTPNQVVVKDYNPKQQRVNQPNVPSDEYLVSPITGERVPADKVGMHLKINMLDPRWLEDRDRQMAEKSNQETVFATGDSVKSSLKQLAERRTDIFGAGDEETGIGKKIGEEEKKEEKVTWDGHTASMEAATRAARANISINEQIHQIHKVKGLLPDQEKEKIGPQPKAAIPPPTEPPKQPVPPPPPKPAPPPPPPAKPQTLPPLPKATPQPQPPPPPKPPVTQSVVPPAQPPMMAPMPMGGPMPPMPPMMQGGSVMMVPRPPVMMAPRANFIAGNPQSQPHKILHRNKHMGLNVGGTVEKEGDDDGPPTKKARTEESLVPEPEWARRYPGPIKFKVQLPLVTEKPEWKLNGQLLNLALPLTDPVSVVKARIHDETGLPPGKQKLARDGMFFKDALSLAYYNIGVGTTIQLQLKERGGRKK
ncbi:Splicing factor 3A subunit 1 [Armadillidium nasatum]|uniref:Splicing factor 3A subunit 1 n=1 Tax=Armadillidium nasatum TaxID=96803 RepID=A0A5N5SQB6_9CRUS|nr:Splicing factor 3A subunit 1 [Armadillidium nasatum]